MLAWVTDGGLETDLLFHKGLELPEFAAFPLVEQPAGARVLAAYHREYVAVAVRAGAGIILETPTWRANPDWGGKLGSDAAALDRVNRAAVDLVRAVGTWETPVRVSGMVGPRVTAALLQVTARKRPRSTTDRRSAAWPQPVSTSCTR